ncbi:TadE/TadG family type IV pilus assembly protein [Hoeflea sp.]|uniref:TadE/TadG family type IV pilus assembly protein n=1 Tax=Hoeflea sp. TaxID=1940281 RepID=UPI00199A9C07|nr:TadE/TadG family type IV pilus assembly protein [Hoeflea sp.]MBC7285327.1 pilus assembly protein [Hoeflea sp.]
MSNRVQWCRLAGCGSGVAAVEFAMIVFLLISLLLGTFEFGRALLIRNQLAFSADIATRRVLVDPPETMRDLEDLETEIRGLIAFDQSGLEIGLDLSPDNRFMLVSMRQPLTLLVPDLLRDSITLSVDRQIPLR